MAIIKIIDPTDKTLADYNIDERTLTVKRAMVIQYDAKKMAAPLRDGQCKSDLIWLDVLLSKFIASKCNG